MKTITITSAKTNTNQASLVDRLADKIADGYTNVAESLISATSCVSSDVSDIIGCAPAIWEQSKTKAQSRMEARMAARGYQIVRS